MHKFVRKILGEPKLRRTVKAAAQLEVEKMQELVVEKAFQHFGDSPRDDDVTILVIEISQSWVPEEKPLGNSSPLSLPFS